MGRAAGVDLGTRRIGVAVSDSAGVLASPLATIDRHDQSDDALEAVAALLVDERVEVVVVGLPLKLDGRQGESARAARRDAEALSELLEGTGAQVELFDERLTTVSAHRSLREAGRGGRARRSRVDQAAAAVLLQSWLDRRGPTPLDEPPRA